MGVLVIFIEQTEHSFCVLSLVALTFHFCFFSSLKSLQWWYV